MLTRRDFLIVAAGPPLLLHGTMGRAQVPLDPTALSLGEAAQFIRRRSTLFEDVDLVLTRSGSVSEKIADVRPDVYSPPRGPPNPFIVMNGCGVPALSMPCGFSSAGLPVGIQVAAPMWREGRILALVHAYQERTSWHRASPGFAPSRG